jgi:O-methyltransferase
MSFDRARHLANRALARLTGYKFARRSHEAVSRSRIKRFVNDNLTRLVGYELMRNVTAPTLPRDIAEEFSDEYYRFRPYTLTTPENMYALHKAVEFIVKAAVPGDVVECGVWKGGSMMIAANALLRLKDTSRRLYLYDTYAGMSRPTERDRILKGNVDVLKRWHDLQRGDHNEWFYAPLHEVRANLETVGYPKERMKFVKGRVEDTIPATIPDSISLLRLDLDIYGPTKHASKQLFPRLSRHGILILDDYWGWTGERAAVDEYFKKHGIVMYLHRLGSSPRIGIKI